LPIAQHTLTIVRRRGGAVRAQFFLDGGHPTAMMQKHRETIDGPHRRRSNARIMAVMRGNREPWSVARLDIQGPPGAPNESQFLQTLDTQRRMAPIYWAGYAGYAG